MDIKQKLQELGLPLEYADGSFAATINHLDLEEAKKIGRYLFAYGVRITKASEIKFYLCNEEEIKEILTRLQWCQENGVDYLDENGNNKDFVFNKYSFYEQFPNANLSAIIPDAFRDKEVIKEEMIQALEGEDSGLTEENYDKYVKLESVLTNVSQVLGGTGEISPIATSNLIKLISSNIICSDSEILFAALVYNQNRSSLDINRISDAITRVMESLNQGGSLNL